MMNHTLNHMTVPKRAPIVIHCPASVVKSPLSPVKPLPKIKYFQSSIRRPVRNVNIAPQRNHHSARGINWGTTSLLVAGCKAAVTWALMRLKKYSTPIQVIPATKWIQRNNACSTSLASTVHLLFLRVYFAYPTDSFQTSSDPAQVVL